jgi:hypothetical protein
MSALTCPNLESATPGGAPEKLVTPGSGTRAKLGRHAILKLRANSAAWMSGAVLASLLVGASARAADWSPWGAAERWIGHNPSETLTSDRATFFDLPAISQLLPRLLTPVRLARFASYHQSDKVAQVDHFLVARKCKDGGCGTGSITMILDQSSKNMWLVMKENDGQEFSRCWTGTTQYQVLPGALQAAFNSD